MGLIASIRKLFSKKAGTASDITATIEILKLSQDIHAEAIATVIDKMKNSEDFKDLVANAVSNLDGRVDQIEKMAGFLYDRSNEQNNRLGDLEDRTTKEEFTKYSTDLTNKSSS